MVYYSTHRAVVTIIGYADDIAVIIVAKKYTSTWDYVYDNLGYNKKMAEVSKSLTSRTENWGYFDIEQEENWIYHT